MHQVPAGTKIHANPRFTAASGTAAGLARSMQNILATARHGVPPIYPKNSQPIYLDDTATTRVGAHEGERERLIRAMEQCGRIPARGARLLLFSPRQLTWPLQKNRIEVRTI